MQNILVSIEADLPSSIALRYACRLADLAQAKVQIIHVKEPDEAGPAVGAGWARLTWQKELLAQARQEITQLLRDDLTHCATLAEPIVAVGGRESHVLAELGRKAYDLLVEGLPAPPGPSLLHHALRSELLQKAPCPVLLALTMAPLERALLCLDAGEAGQVECFGRLFAGSGLRVDLLGLDFPESGAAAAKNGLEQRLEQARQGLSGLGFKVEKQSLGGKCPGDMAAYSEDYGLVVAPLLREPHRQQSWVTLLGNTSTSMLLC